MLIALVPTLTLFASNLTLLPGGLVWRPFAVSVAFALILWALFTVIFRNLERGAIAATVAVGGFFLYGRLLQMTGQPGQVGTAICYSLVVLILGFLAGFKLRATGLFNFFSAALVALFLVNVSIGLAKESHSNAINGAQIGQAAGRLPDVYYIILDGHGREDVLRDMYGLTDHTLAQGLRERGFYVADKAHSNYVQTELSMASSLNMNHLSAVIPGDPGENNRAPFDEAIKDNSVQKTFTGLGYQLIGITTGFPAISFPQAKTGYSVRSGMSLLEAALVQSTPLAENTQILGSQFSMRRRWLLDGFSALEEVSGESSKPKMVVAHILAPHPPFVFGPNGEPVQQGRGFGYYDGSDYLNNRLSKEDYRKGYAGQERYMANLTLHMVDTILARSKVKPVIIIQGDHGPKSELDQNDLAKTQIDECFPILNAYYGPEALTSQLYPEVTPVNSFRLVFSALTGQKQNLLPDRSYYSPFGHPMQLTDVTEKLKR